MIPVERRQKMLALINEQRTVAISELSKIFAVSEMTIHRDLEYLETSGRVRKTYGGVIATQTIVETDFERRKQTNIEAKQIIGKAAVTMVEDGDAILVDASTTCLAMLPGLINKKNLTVFTTGVSASSVLSENPNIELHCTGGMVEYVTNSFIGANTIEELKKIHVDKCFVGAAGINCPDGITDPILSIAEVKKYSARASNEVIILVDHSKFGRTTRFEVLSLKEIDLIITDTDEDIPCIEEIKQEGVEILIANKFN
jgi:DeoR family fructose operon transcriptional repressor